MDIKNVRKSVDGLYNQISHATCGPLGVLGLPGAGHPTPSAYWNQFKQEDARLLVESIYGLKECLTILQHQWVEANKDLPTETITAKVWGETYGIPSETKEIEVRLIPSLEARDWHPHSSSFGLGFLVETADGKFEVDNYPHDPQAYPKKKQIDSNISNTQE
jgi:hypothetical protein